MDGPVPKLATIVLNRAALTPSRLRGRGVNYRAQHAEQMELDDQDADAPVAEELEEEREELDDEADAEGEEVEDEEDLGSEADAEGEMEDDDDEEGEFVGAVKTRLARTRSRKQAESDVEDAEAEPDDDSESGSSQGEEEDWEAADEDVEEDQKIANADANRCMYVLKSVSCATAELTQIADSASKGKIKTPARNSKST